MKTYSKKAVALSALLALLVSLDCQLSTACAQGTAFTYQGRLNANGSAANGNYDFRFRLFLDPLGSNQAGSTLLSNMVPVHDGLFIVTLDFGAGVFNGSNCWLEVDVKTNGATSYVDLSPLQAVTPAPYAIFANSANDLVSSAQLNVPGLAIQNNTNGAPNLIGGSSANSISNGVLGATIGGGGQANFGNHVTADFGTVSGGGGNTASGWASTVSGGADNTASSPDGSATIGGGYFNTASGDSSIVSGGTFNTAFGAYSAIGGGANNTNESTYGTIGGGGRNFIGINSTSGTVGGGYGNQIADNTPDSTIGGGSYGSIGTNSLASTIAGGSHNSISNNAAMAVIGGGTNNIAGGLAATVSGGYENTAAWNYATVGGGYRNFASGNFNFGDSATVGGGYENSAVGNNAVVAGGVLNFAEGDNTAIGGGGYNTNSGSGSAIGGGYFNQASGYAATIPGGNKNIATGDYSFAAGNDANAMHSGSFVWSDVSGGPFSTTANNQFLIRAAGGVGINTNSTAGALTVSTGAGTLTMRSDGPVPALVAANSGPFYSGYLRLRNHLEVWPNDTATAAGYVDIRGTNGAQNIILDGQSGDITCVALNQTSDRNSKSNFASVNAGAVLAKVAVLPITEWVYKSDAGARHVGPMAQDFHAAFGLNGSDDKHITTVDEGGVALAAIQGLNQKLEARTRQLEAENADLKARLEKLEKIVFKQISN